MRAISLILLGGCISFQPTDGSRVGLSGVSGGDGGPGGVTGSSNAGMESCVASAEVCNGVDDDCDTLVDEDFSLGVACDGSDSDQCSDGVFVCDGLGGQVCNDNAASAGEMCNGIDDDCDGVVDDGVVGVGVPCEAHEQSGCNDGTVACTPAGAHVCIDSTEKSIEDVCTVADDNCMDGTTPLNVTLSITPHGPTGQFSGLALVQGASGLVLFNDEWVNGDNKQHLLFMQRLSASGVVTNRVQIGGIYTNDYMLLSIDAAYAPGVDKYAVAFSRGGPLATYTGNAAVQVLNPDGSPNGPEVNLGNVSNTKPHIAWDATLQRFAVVWTGPTCAAAGSQSCVQLVSAAGVAEAGAGTDVSQTGATGTVGDLAIASLGGGNIAVVWRSFTAMNMRVLSYASASAVPSMSANVVLGASDSAQGPRIAWNGSEMGVAWRINKPAQASYQWLQLARVSSTGALLAGPGSVPDISDKQRSLPGIIWDGDSWLFVWNDDRATPRPWQLTRATPTGANQISLSESDTPVLTAGTDLNVNAPFAFVPTSVGGTLVWLRNTGSFGFTRFGCLGY